MVYDLIIIGAGPNGLTLAIEAIKKKLKVLVLEKDSICFNLKRLGDNFVLASSTPENLSIASLVSEKITVDEFYKFYIKQVLNFNINIVYEKVNKVLKSDSIFTVKTDNSDFHSKNVAIATGIYDNHNSAETSIISDHVEYYMPLAKVNNKKIIIVGAGNAAIKTAIDLYKNNEVILLSRSTIDADRIFYMWKDDFLKILKDRSIKVLENTAIEKIIGKKCIISDKNNTILDFDLCYLLIGYHPNFEIVSDLLKIENGAYLNHNIYNCQTDISGLFVFGICAGKIFVNKEKVFYLKDSKYMADKVIERLS